MYGKCGDHVEARKVFDKMPERNLYSWNNLLSGFAGLGMVKPARRVFDRMTERDIVSWNTMIIAYARNRCCDEALRFYKELRRLSIGVNEFSFAGVLTVCVKMRDAGLTRQVHCQVLTMGYSPNVIISSSIVDSYSKCGAMIDGRRVFDEMSTKDVLAWTTLVSGYAKWGDMKSAAELFNLMPAKNPISWTALISGYARNNMGSSALELFTKMMIFRIRPDQFTFSSCLCACASIASLKHGKQIHAYLIRTGFKPNTIVVSSLIDMYSKCGYLNYGKLVFDIMGNKQDTVLWNTMISALAYHGHCDDAIKYYSNMVSLGVKPDRITFIVIISACSHLGNVEDGLKYFSLMSCDYGIVPDQEHYACLVDLLGQAGCFEELINQLQKMPCIPDKLAWNALIGLCKIHENLDLGIQTAEKLIEMEPQSSTACAIL